MGFSTRILLAGVSLVAFAVPGFAQDAATAPQDTAGQSDRDLNDIIVTARRRAETVQDVPLTVNAVTAATVDKLNLRRFEDVTSVVPGLNISSSRSSAGSPSTLRGVNFQSGVSGVNQTVGYYFNDASIAPNGVTFALFDLAGIEVLRGPQGTLRGRSTPSGSINVTTRKPDLSEVGGYVNGTLYDPMGYNFNGALNIPVVADKLAVRIAGVMAKDRGDTVRALTGGLDPLSETEGLRASVSADPFEGVLLLDFVYQTLQRDNRIYEQVESANQIASYVAINPAVGASPVAISAKDRRALTGAPLTNETRFRTFNWHAGLNLWGQSLNYIGIHTDSTFHSVDPQDEAGIVPSDILPLGSPFATARGNFAVENRTPSKATVHEIRLQNEERVAGMFDYVIGGLFRKDSADAGFTTPTLAFNPAVGYFLASLRSGRRASNTKETSVFGNLTAYLGPKTEVSGGVRHIWYKDNGKLFDGVTEIVPYTTNIDTNATIYTASIKHRFSDQIMVYANTGTSWRPNGVAIGGPLAPSPLQQSFLTTPPETSRSYEIGVKTDLFDRKLQINVTAYQQKFKNYPYRAYSPVYAYDRFASLTAGFDVVRGFNYVAPVPVTVKGVEAEFNARPLRNLTISGNLAYTDGKIKGGLIPCLDIFQANGAAGSDGIPDVVFSPPSAAQLRAAYGAEFIAGCRTNEQANIAPKWSGSLTSEYWLPLDGKTNIFGRGLYSWNGKTLNDPTNAFDNIKAYGILNIYAGLRDADDAWEISLYAKNIANSFRVLSRSNGPTATVRNGQPVTSTNYFGITTTMPREIGITARFAFGAR